MENKAQIRDFLRMLLERKGDNEGFSDDSSLLLSGRLSSVDAVQIVVLLERDFGLDFNEIGFDQGEIDSLNSIDALVQRVQSGK